MSQRSRGGLETTRARQHSKHVEGRIVVRFAFLHRHVLHDQSFLLIGDIHVEKYPPAYGSDVRSTFVAVYILQLIHRDAELVVRPVQFTMTVLGSSDFHNAIIDPVGTTKSLFARSGVIRTKRFG